MAGVYRTALLSLNEITVLPGRREVVKATVESLAASIKKIGMQNPISVRSEKGRRFVLIAGRHRLEAMRILGENLILASVMNIDDVEARLWEISENLHRAELTVLERSEQVSEWVSLTEAARPQAFSNEVRSKIAKDGTERGRPEGGVRAAARELGMKLTNVQQSNRIAKLTDEAKEAAIEAGLDDNQSALLKIAAATTAAEQVEVVAEIVADKAEPKRRKDDETKVEVVGVAPYSRPAFGWVLTMDAFIRIHTADQVRAAGTYLLANAELAGAA